jgi:hypothetical protein
LEVALLEAGGSSSRPVTGTAVRETLRRAQDLAALKKPCARGIVRLAEQLLQEFADGRLDAADALLGVDLKRRLPVRVPRLRLDEDKVSAGLDRERDERSPKGVRGDA